MLALVKRKGPCYVGDSEIQYARWCLRSCTNNVMNTTKVEIEEVSTTGPDTFSSH